MVEAASWESINNARERFKGDPGSGQHKHDHSSASARLNVGKYLDHFGISHSVKNNGRGTIYPLDHCLFDESHTKNEAAIIQMPDGKLIYQCFHESCKGHTWHTARQVISGNESLRPFMDGVSESYSTRESQAEEWPEPIPLGDYANLPDFPADVLPSPGREMVEAVAEVNQVDKGLVAGCYFAVLSLALAKKVEVDLITHQEPCNCFFVGVAESGTRKTGTLGVMTDCVYEYQAGINQELRPIITQAQADYKILEKRLAKLQDDAVKAKDFTEQELIRQDIKDLLEEMEENKPPNELIIIVDDITTEALANTMAVQDERLAIVSAEGGIFSILAGRYSEKAANFDVVLKGHSGDPWSCHRIGRESKSMMNPALTLCLCVQLEVIREIGRNRSFRGKGLLARFLYCLCKPQAGYRIRQMNTIPPALYDRYAEHVKGLLSIPIPELPENLRFTKDAQALWDDFYNDVEKSMRPGGELESLKDWGSKLPGATARIAGLLHLAKHGQAGLNRDISVNSVGASLGIGAYYKDHALATFGLMGEAPEQEAAKLILEYLKLHRPRTFTGRDVMRNKNALKTMAVVEGGLKVLLERGYIKEVEAQDRGRGRPAAKSYLTHPLLRA